MFQNIESERKRIGYTKAKLCDEIGITTRTYWNYLNGSPIPSDVLVRMANLFHCSVAYLLGLASKRDGT